MPIKDIFNTDINNEQRLRIKLNENFSLLASRSSSFTGGTLDSIVVTGNSIFTQNISATTIYSGATNLNDLLGTGAGGPGDITRVQSGINVFTGGTGNKPTINLTSATINNLSASGLSQFNSLSAQTIYSGSSNLYDFFISTGDTLYGGSF